MFKYSSSIHFLETVIEAEGAVESQDIHLEGVLE